MEYRCVATTRRGFIRQLIQYLAHGYWFYVTGHVKPGRDPRAVDRTLLAKYGVAISRQARWRRKRQGFANVHYLRHGSFWILVATKGSHAFFEEHVKRDRKGKVITRYFRDARKDSILFKGYAASVRRGTYRPYRSKQDKSGPPERDDKFRVRIQISQSTYRALASEYVELAKRGRFSAGALEAMVYRLAFEPYAPVRQQLLNLVRRMNKARRQQGLKDSLCPKRAIRYRIDPISAFAPHRPLTPKGDEVGDGVLAA